MKWAIEDVMIYWRWWWRWWCCCCRFSISLFQAFHSGIHKRPLNMLIEHLFSYSFYVLFIFFLSSFLLLHSWNTPNIKHFGLLPNGNQMSFFSDDDDDDYRYFDQMMRLTIVFLSAITINFLSIQTQIQTRCNAYRTTCSQNLHLALKFQD